MMGSKGKGCTVALVARHKIDMEETASDGADSWYVPRSSSRGFALHYHFIDGIRI